MIGWREDYVNLPCTWDGALPCAGNVRSCTRAGGNAVHKCVCASIELSGVLSQSAPCPAVESAVVRCHMQPCWRSGGPDYWFCTRCAIAAGQGCDVRLLQLAPRSGLCPAQASLKHGLGWKPCTPWRLWRAHWLGAPFPPIGPSPSRSSIICSSSSRSWTQLCLPVSCVLSATRHKLAPARRRPGLRCFCVHVRHVSRECSRSCASRTHRSQQGLVQLCRSCSAGSWSARTSDAQQTCCHAGWASWDSLATLNMTDCTGLRGTLPAEWASMASMTYLSFQNNSLAGTLPPEWGALNATYVNLYQNSLTGGCLAFAKC